MSIINNYPHKIIWDQLSINTSAIELIKRNLNRINWRLLSTNPAAIDLLEKYKNHINYTELSMNPAIFEFDYVRMAHHRMSVIEEELISAALHPKRIEYWLNNGVSMDDI
jgi:hypothetical protein